MVVFPTSKRDDLYLQALPGYDAHDVANCKVDFDCHFVLLRACSSYLFPLSTSVCVFFY